MTARRWGFTPIPSSTEAEIQAAIDALVAGAPGALDTLNELAAALGDDANFATTVTNSLAGKIPKSLVDAAGDLITATADDTPSRLAKGSPLQVLRVNAGGTALEYATPSGGGDGPGGPALKSGYYVRPLGALNGTSMVALRCYFVPLAIERAISIDRIGTYISGGGGVGTVIRFMVYADSNGVPDALLVDGGTVNANSTGPAEVTVNTALSVGKVWIAMVSDGTPSVSAFQFGGAVGADDLTEVTNTGKSCYQATLASTAAPSPAPAVSHGTLTPPLPAVRVA